MAQRSFVWTVVSKKASVFLSLCSISTTASLVNKVHSVSQLAEMCVSVSILIQSISMGSMSYSVCCCSLCVCVCVCAT